MERPQSPSSIADLLRTPVRGCSVYLPLEHTFVTGTVDLERACSLRYGLRCIGRMKIGAFSYSFTHLSHHIAEVGRYCSMGGEITFGTAEHPVDWLSTSSFTFEPFFLQETLAERLGTSRFQCTPSGERFGHKDIRIGNDVWIGMRAYIRSGIVLHDGCIVAAGAVVTKDVPPFAVVAGNPARVVKQRFDDAIIRRIQRLRWWRYAFTDFSDMDTSRVEASLDRLEALIDGGLEEFDPGFIRLEQGEAGLRATAL